MIPLILVTSVAVAKIALLHAVASHRPRVSPTHRIFVAAFLFAAAALNIALARVLVDLRGAELRSIELAAFLSLCILDLFVVLALALTSENDPLLRIMDGRVQPHFVFNAMNAISALLPDDPAAAERMTARLADLLREGFSPGAAPRIPLRDEVAFVRNYAEVEQIRFAGKLHVLWEIPEDLLAAAVPRLFLQPLVENAIKHGLLSADGSCIVTIRAFRSAHDLVVVVSNEAGAATAAPAPVRESFGIGLRAVRDRLTALHGDRAALRLERTRRSGAQAIVTIPYEEIRAGTHC